jgi:hypothetical protein
MPNGFGQGRGFGRGAGGGGMGFGFRGSSPAWPYVGRGRGGLPRCGYGAGIGAPAAGFYQPPYSATPAPGYDSYAAEVSKEDELGFMKNQAEAIKTQLEEIKSRMHDLEKE